MQASIIKTNIWNMYIMYIMLAISHHNSVAVSAQQRITTNILFTVTRDLSAINI